MAATVEAAAVGAAPDATRKWWTCSLRPFPVSNGAAVHDAAQALDRHAWLDAYLRQN